MGFEQLSNITNGKYNLGQLLFTGKIGDNGELNGDFKKVNNNKHIGSNSERLTAAQNSTTRSAVVSTLNAEFSNKEVGARLDAIKDYLTGIGQADKALYREEVGAMINILNGEDDLSADAVKAKLDAVRAEQEFKQLRKMTVESNFGLGNIVMTKGSGQFEKVNHHKIKKDENNIDLTKLGGVEGEEAAWETNETTSDHIEAVLQMHFADKSSKLAEAIQMAKNGEFGSKDLTNRATLSKLIEFMENKAPSDAFATKSADIMAVKNDAEFCKLIGKLDAEIVQTLDSECAKFLSESKNLTLALLSPQGKYAVMRWANADQEGMKVASRLVQEVKRFLEDIKNGVQDEIESPIGTSGEKLFKNLKPDTSFVDGENVCYKSPMDYFVRVHLYDQLDSTKMKATSELLSGVALDLSKCPILKDYFNPPINLIFKSYAWGNDNGKNLRMGLFLSAVHKAKEKGVSQNTIASALISRNQELLAEVKSILEVQEATTENSTSQVELTVENKAKKLGFPTLDEYIQTNANKLGLDYCSRSKVGLA